MQVDVHWTCSPSAQRLESPSGSPAPEVGGLSAYSRFEFESSASQSQEACTFLLQRMTVVLASGTSA